MFLRVVWLGVLVATAGVYFPGLSGGFLFDDIPNIVDNPAVHLTTLSLSGLKESLGGVSAGPLERPVSVWSFALTHLLFGLDAYAFKAINVGIHVLNGLLAAWLLALLLQSQAFSRLSPRVKVWLPVWTAAAWLLHPIHFVAISMAVQRMTLLAGMFTLLALIAHLKAVRCTSPGSSKWLLLLAAWGICWPLAFLSKETGLLFPVLAMLLSWLAFDQTGPDHGARNKILFAGTGALALVGALLWWKIGWAWLEAGYSMRDFTMLERLLTQGRVLWFYLFQILTPSYASYGLYLDWIPVSKGVMQPITTLLSLLAWVGVIVAAVVCRRKQPVLAFGVLWFLVGHGLESTFIPLEIAHEHRNYLPALGPLLAAAYFAARLLEHPSVSNTRLVVGAVSISVLALLAALTVLRSLQMSNPLVGSQIEATRHENSARANYVAAWSLIKAGIGDRNDPIGGNSVRFLFEQAERSEDGFKLGYLGLITWSCASGRAVEEAWLASFAEKLEGTRITQGQRALPAYMLKALTAGPACLSRHEALMLFESGGRNPRSRDSLKARFLEAGGDYELLVSRDPDAAHGYYRRASLLDTGSTRLRDKSETLKTGQ